jgi:hypothetical protein
MMACSAATLERVSREDRGGTRSRQGARPSALGLRPHTNEKPARTRTAETAFSRRLQPNFQRPSCRTRRRARGRGAHAPKPRGSDTLSRSAAILLLRLPRKVRATRLAVREHRLLHSPGGLRPTSLRTPAALQRTTMPDTPPARHPIPALSSKPSPTKPRSLVSSEPDWPGPPPALTCGSRHDFHSERRSSVACLLAAGADRRAPRKHTPKTPIEHTPRERNVPAGHPAPRAPD